jgi:hypothetical protein
MVIHGRELLIIVGIFVVQAIIPTWVWDIAVTASDLFRSVITNRDAIAVATK